MGREVKHLADGRIKLAISHELQNVLINALKAYLYFQGEEIEEAHTYALLIEALQALERHPVKLRKSELLALNAYLPEYIDEPTLVIIRALFEPIATAPPSTPLLLID